jgi:hypothetical protein
MDLVLEQLQRGIGESLRGLDAGETQLRSANDARRWSIQQIVEHLLLTYTSTCSSLETRIAKGRPTRTRPNLRQRVVQCAVLRVGYFPVGVKAPDAVMPGATQVPLSGDRLAEQTSEMLEQMDGLAVQVEGLLGEGRSMSHQVLGPLSVADWRRFHLVHGEHHLKQIRAIRRANGL